MLFPFTVAALVTIFTTGVSGIINGLGTRIHDAPFAVMIFDRSDLQAFTGLICGGAIISRRYILTAAHCLGEPVSDNDVKYHHEWLRVMAGVSSYTCGIRTYEISNAFIHPDFTGDLNRAGSVRGDVAVLQVRTQQKTSEFCIILVKVLQT
ncbi:venom serine protease-like [Diachasmimorpha longicaudata]|uniref:venom serine protease-like n=1 Tax=Diachasmimorpha longicaudata TaxID=58733 RepID=UPI0030B8B981